MAKNVHFVDLAVELDQSKSIRVKIQTESVEQQRTSGRDEQEEGLTST
jgi:hypothetical protein